MSLLGLFTGVEKLRRAYIAKVQTTVQIIDSYTHGQQQIRSLPPISLLPLIHPPPFSLERGGPPWDSLSSNSCLSVGLCIRFHQLLGEASLMITGLGTNLCYILEFLSIFIVDPDSHKTKYYRHCSCIDEAVLVLGRMTEEIIQGGIPVEGRRPCAFSGGSCTEVRQQDVEEKLEHRQPHSPERQN
ncbi:hypothetical protein STEG23_027931 [Scotinomys teguina]